MEGVIESSLDKECGALSGLFQQIISEMKNGTPIFDEFVSRAGKLHTTLKSTIIVLGSFLDSFQKIADAASNTKGATRDIGTCLTRIVIRHRALESRMKTLAGALMDCLVLPIQGKLEEWKKCAVTLDKEHSKGYKKSRSQIKKKSDQVQRLKKKLKKEKVPDPSVQRLFDQCSKDLNAQFKTFEKTERTAVRKAFAEDRNRYCTFVAFLKPVLDEEIAMFTEIHQIEEILSKLNRTASLKESTDIFIEDFVKNGVIGKEGEDTGSICLSTPPSTPSSSMGSRKGSMSSLNSGGSTGTSNSSVSIDINGSPTQRSIQSGSDYETYTATKTETLCTRPSSSLSHQKFVLSNPLGDIARPMSSTSWDGAHQVRPHTISTTYDKRTQRPIVNGATFVLNHVESGNNTDSELEEINSKSLLNQYNNFSTIKRTYSPFHRISDSHTLVKRPPLPQRCSSADRSIPSSSFNGAYIRCASIDRASSHNNKPMRSSDNGPHYAIPKPTLNLTMVPNFHSDKRDMVIPHPVYMNCKDLDKMKKCKPAINTINDVNGNPNVNETVSPKSEQLSSEDDLKTPTVEELSFPGKKVTVSAEDGSSSSSGSIGSSSGYGSQCTIKFDENMPQCSIEGQSTPHSSPPHVHQNHHESYHHPNFLENRQFISNIMTLKRRSLSLRRNNDPCSQGCNLSPSHNGTTNQVGLNRSNSHSCDVKPPPPMRRSSIGNKDSLSPSKTLNNVSLEPGQNDSSLMTDEDDTTPRGSVEDLPPMMANQEPLSILRRSTSMTGPPVQILERNDRFRRSYQPGEKTSLFSTLSSKLNQRLKIEERPDPYLLKLKSKSPDTEDKYGFGVQFQSTRQDYFKKSTREVKDTYKDNINAKIRLNPNSSNGA